MSGNGESNVRWRYQAVWEEDESGKLFSVIEVYIQDGKLDSWTEPSRAAGESLDELLSDLRKRHADCSAYRPVAFEDLEVGIEFERSTDGPLNPATDC